MKPPIVRTGADRCPGALQPFAAEDGLIVRARVPGGEVAVSTLQQLMQIAVEHGTPRIQLTTRANLQIRGLPEPIPPDVATRMADAGLLPSITHERARNILAAPGNPQLRARARQLDRLLQDRPVLAGLPGRFLMLLTDSSGVGLNEPFDVAYADHGDGSGMLLTGDGGRPCEADAALEAMLDLAERFLAERTDERIWNIRDLPTHAALRRELTPVTVTVGPPPAAGAIGDDLMVGVPLGLLSPGQLDAIASVTQAIVITPWRSLLIENGAAYAGPFSRAGLLTSPDSAWGRISACTGAPHCTRAISETMTLARDCAASLPAEGPRIHLAGCERSCGRPRTEHLSIVGAHSLDEVRDAMSRSVPSSP